MTDSQINRSIHCAVATPVCSVILTLVCATAPAISGAAQSITQVLSVADAKQHAAQLGTEEIRVRGHFWWGKEGSMIYGSYYKPIIGVRYSEVFNKKHPGVGVFPPESKRTSNIAVITGHLGTAENGHLVIIADDIEFTGEPKL